MGFDMKILHAPSASGKTTFLQQGESHPFELDLRSGGVNLGDFLHRFGSTGIVDGDDIIHFTVGWPRDKVWWRKNGATLVHFTNIAAILNAAARLIKPDWMTTLVVMFNGGMKNLSRAEEFYLNISQSDAIDSFEHLAVVPNREVHERNIESRRKENLQEGRSWTFPRNWSDAQNNRKAVEALASKFGTPVAETFEDALKGLIL